MSANVPLFSLHGLTRADVALLLDALDGQEVFLESMRKETPPVRLPELNQRIEVLRDLKKALNT